MQKTTLNAATVSHHFPDLPLSEGLQALALAIGWATAEIITPETVRVTGDGEIVILTLKTPLTRRSI